MSCQSAYTHPVYHGGKNQPEQVTEEFLCHPAPGQMAPPPMDPQTTAQRMNPQSYVSFQAQHLSPQGGVNKMSQNLFVNTQIDRLLRRHNKARGRDDTFYNITGC